MNIKKITAIAAAVIIAAGICTGVPTGTGTGSPLAVTVSANTVSQSYSASSAAENNLPANYSATGGNNTIDVKWDAVSGATSYSISVMKKTGDNSFTQVDSKTVTTTSCKFENISADTYTISIQPSNAELVVVLDNVLVTGKLSLDNAAASATSSKEEFVTKIDQDGDKYLEAYNGKGGDVVIPDGVIWIAKGVFAGNDTITSVTIPKSCIWVDESSFEECLNLKTVVFKGDVGIYNKAFRNCIKLESVTVNGSIYDGIYPNAFTGCQSLKTFKIKGDKNEFAIGALAFSDCYSLSSINIPSKCTEIHGKAFLNCFNLTKLTIPAKTKINTEVIADYHFGYAETYKSKSDADKALADKSSNVKSNTYVADGKTKGYVWYISGYDYNKKQFNVISKQYTPKQLTLTVTKGSPAEKWAKANKVKYTYAGSSSSSGSAAAPSNIKASKTNNSVTLSWDKADGADMYRVYKYNDKTGKYEKYKDVTSAKCTVSGLKAGTKYKFKVVSYSKNKDGKYVKGESSKAVSVTTTK